MRSGKGLGGSTMINGMAWSKPHDFQLDALESVGNEGVNWASLQPYVSRSLAQRLTTDAARRELPRTLRGQL